MEVYHISPTLSTIISDFFLQREFSSAFQSLFLFFDTEFLNMTKYNLCDILFSQFPNKIVARFRYSKRTSGCGLRAFLPDTEAALRKAASVLFDGRLSQRRGGFTLVMMEK